MSLRQVEIAAVAVVILAALVAVWLTSQPRVEIIERRSEGLRERDCEWIWSDSVGTQPPECSDHQRE